MSAVKDGGPAFPHDFIGHMSTGMSLRDWFAGQALAAITTSATAHAKTFRDGADLNTAIAETAFGLADAMLAARKAEAEHRAALLDALAQAEGRT